MDFEKCLHMVKCWDLLKRPCVRPKFHMDNGNSNCHNPFSNTPPPSNEIITIRKPVVAISANERWRERELVNAA